MSSSGSNNTSSNSDHSPEQDLNPSVPPPVGNSEDSSTGSDGTTDISIGIGRNLAGNSARERPVPRAPSNTPVTNVTRQPPAPKKNETGSGSRPRRATAPVEKATAPVVGNDKPNARTKSNDSKRQPPAKKLAREVQGVPLPERASLPRKAKPTSISAPVPNAKTRAREDAVKAKALDAGIHKAQKMQYQRDPSRKPLLTGAKSMKSLGPEPAKHMKGAKSMHGINRPPSENPEDDPMFKLRQKNYMKWVRNNKDRNYIKKDSIPYANVETRLEVTHEEFIIILGQEGLRTDGLSRPRNAPIDISRITAQIDTGLPNRPKIIPLKKHTTSPAKDSEKCPTCGSDKGKSQGKKTPPPLPPKSHKDTASSKDKSKSTPSSPAGSHNTTHSSGNEAPRASPASISGTENRDIAYRFFLEAAAVQRDAFLGEGRWDACINYNEKSRKFSVPRPKTWKTVESILSHFNRGQGLTKEEIDLIRKTNAATQDFLTGWIMGCISKLLRKLETPDEKSKEKTLPAKRNLRSDRVHQANEETQTSTNQHNSDAPLLQMIDPRTFMTTFFADLIDYMKVSRPGPPLPSIIKQEQISSSPTDFMDAGSIASGSSSRQPESEYDIIEDNPMMTIDDLPVYLHESDFIELLGVFPSRRLLNFNGNILRIGDLTSLFPGQLVNDETISQLFELIANDTLMPPGEGNQFFSPPNPLLKRCLTCSIVFALIHVADGNDASNLIQQLQDKNIRDMDLFGFPYHIDDINHYIMVVADIKSKDIRLFDPKQPEGTIGLFRYSENCGLMLSMSRKKAYNTNIDVKTSDNLCRAKYIEVMQSVKQLMEATVGGNWCQGQPEWPQSSQFIEIDSVPIQEDGCSCGILMAAGFESLSGRQMFFGQDRTIENYQHFDEIEPELYIGHRLRFFNELMSRGELVIEPDADAQSVDSRHENVQVERNTESAQKSSTKTKSKPKQKQRSSTKDQKSSSAEGSTGKDTSLAPPPLIRPAKFTFDMSHHRADPVQPSSESDQSGADQNNDVDSD